MKLWEIIKKTPSTYDEVTVLDNVYDIEFYMYRPDADADDWDKACVKLAKLLEVDEVCANGAVVVKFTELVESHLEELKKADLFIRCNIDDIMCDMHMIMAGYVSEDWLTKFVDVLSK